MLSPPLTMSPIQPYLSDEYVISTVRITKGQQRETNINVKWPYKQSSVERNKKFEYQSGPFVAVDGEKKTACNKRPFTILMASFMAHSCHAKLGYSCVIERNNDGNKRKCKLHYVSTSHSNDNFFELKRRSRH